MYIYVSKTSKELQISTELQLFACPAKAGRNPFTKSAENGSKKYNALYENTLLEHDLYTIMTCS